jgi:ribosome-associated protein YbcJ (S4-like RNA binding protein)
MPTEFLDDGTIDKLLRLADVSTERSAARGWLESALVAARGTPEPRRSNRAKLQARQTEELADLGISFRCRGCLADNEVDALRRKAAS